MKITNSEDLIKIQNRSPELQAQMLFFGGLTKTQIENFKWEKKYKIIFSIPIKDEEIKMANKVGMIPKPDLKNKVYYWGITNNGRVARWSSNLQMFEILKFKSGWNVHRSFHPEDMVIDTRSLAADIFIPWYEVKPTHTELISASEKPGL